MIFVQNALIDKVLSIYTLNNSYDNYYLFNYLNEYIPLIKLEN